MRIFGLLIFLILTFKAFGGEPFPRIPSLSETPGKLCANPSSVRYPEKIAYCERDVDVYMKEDVIARYDNQLGYKIRTMNRYDFKIDHLIPLCAGGDNVEDNLWPQHKSVYAITDPIEPLICQRMEEGKLSQKEAVQMVIYAKTHLNELPRLMKILGSM